MYKPREDREIVVISGMIRQLEIQMISEEGQTSISSRVRACYISHAASHAGGDARGGRRRGESRH
jgi:hypothetical protein